MGNLKRLAKKTDGIVNVLRPLSDSEINSRSMDYPLLTPIDFAKKYRNVLFRPVNLEFNELSHSIQMNHCTDPFCKWYGQEQVRFEEVKSKPYRYRLSGDLSPTKITLSCRLSFEFLQKK